MWAAGNRDFVEACTRDYPLPLVESSFSNNTMSSFARSWPLVISDGSLVAREHVLRRP